MEVLQNKESLIKKKDIKEQNIKEQNIKEQNIKEQDITTINNNLEINDPNDQNDCSYKNSLDNLSDFEMDDSDDMSSEDSKNQEYKEEKSLLVAEEFQNVRLDKYLSVLEEDISRSYLQKLINDQLVTVNGKVVKSNYKLNKGDEVHYFVPFPTILLVEAEDIPLDIIYEDDDIVVINKKKGMVVHPAAGHYNGTLVNALMFHCRDNLSGINGVMRPGIVHRIDRNTTGVLVVCKNDKAHQLIAEQLKVHSITRKYEAIVYGTFKDDGGKVDAPIGRHQTNRKKMAINYKNGKRAVTNYKVIENFGKQYAHIECSLETGRTHQIRVHMASIHHPLLGDDVYGREKEQFTLEGQALHARVLGFIHPTTKQYVEFRAPLPDYFQTLLDKLRSK